MNIVGTLFSAFVSIFSVCWTFFTLAEFGIFVSIILLEISYNC